jgi:hypothetical protein
MRASRQFCSQLTTQQQENKKLMDLTQKLQDNASLEHKKRKQQMGHRDKQWKEQSDKETAIWTDMLRQAKHNIETTTNQTINVYESVNDCLQQENKLIKASCDSQAKQHNTMRQQIAKLLAQQSLTSQHTKPHLTDQDLKRNTPTTPTAMSDSPEHVLNKKTTADMVPQ